MHNAKAILTTRRAGGLFVLQSSVFRINEKLLNGEQGPALTIKEASSSELDAFLSDICLYLCFGTRTVLPPIYGCRTAGIFTLPSACKLFSKNAISIRGGATTVLFKV